MAIKIALVSTKGGTGKTSIAANLSGLLADLGQRVLLIDGDTGQPALSSYYKITQLAPVGLTGLFQQTPAKTQEYRDGLISQTSCENIDLIYSDDPQAALQDWLQTLPDGRMRLKHLLTYFDEFYDYIILDTRGSVGVVQDSVALAADIMISPIPPEMLSAREFIRGTLKMIDRLKPMEQFGFPIGHMYGVINRLDNTVDSRLVANSLRNDDFEGKVTICETYIPSSVSYRTAATQHKPVHQIDYKNESKIKRPSALMVMASLVSELFPDLREKTAQILNMYELNNSKILESVAINQ